MECEKIKKALQVIEYIKLNKNSYTGRNYQSGYHSIVLDGKLYDGARNNVNRISQVKGFDFLNKVVLDIGCNMGGMLYSMADKIKYGVGIDFDKKCINAANIVRDLNVVRNLNFYVFDLDNEDLNFIKNFIMEDKIDICLFLAVSQHIKRWKEVIQFCFENSDYLLFESNGKLHCQDAQINFIKELYKNTVYLSSEARRKMFLCSKI
jgi:2-polyprenyl-3-methyl-5-hydroxy-6-metoxy-1,4-benzoquinol methylase